MRYLDEAGVDYDVMDVDKPGVKQQMFARFGVLVVPVIVVGKKAFFGFDENRLELDRSLRNGESRNT